MDDEFLKLIELARSGQPEPFQRLVDAVSTRSAGNPAVLVRCARSPDEVCRRAAITAARGRTEPEVLEAIAALADDPAVSVRQCLAYALTDYSDWPLDGTADWLLSDSDSNVRQAAWAARYRPGLVAALLNRLLVEPNSWVRSEVAYALGDCPARQVLPEVLACLAEDGDAGIQQACAATAERHLVGLGSYPADLARPAPNALLEVRRRLATFTSGSYPSLTAWLNEQLVAHVDVTQLSTYGTVLTTEAEKGQLPHAYGVDAVIEAILPLLDSPPPRALVLTGESGSGKTAAVYELTHRLRSHPDGPWYVLRISPSEFMKGTRYLGEWETRVSNIVAAVKPPRRVLLYVPNLEELSSMGTWEKSNASVASALAPSIERGDVTILGESTIEAFRKGLGADRSLRRLFHAIDVPAAGAHSTRDILQKVAEEAGAAVPESVLDRLGELAEFFVAGAVEPGRSVGLLRRVLGVKAGHPGPLTEQDVLETISQSTGVPVEFLDDSTSLDRAQVRSFFESRVMGQPEAVDAVLDLVTLVKAGLNDPNKPYGVLLFVGPTGVGKTELARALAEHLFGDPARMIRLDMSEFATYEAFERLIGQGWRSSEPGLLTAAVRERPFAVLLFDEIEKAHPNIYNLCLQIFDAGRLTDTQGRTADFRRTIIILTSNVGSAIPSEGFVGFGRKAAAAPEREMTLRELGRWFRPEFLNRIDRIVSFRQLAVETAEKIARREVARVMERSGIARRRLAVDVDPEVLPLLLREGYSPTFGARPLKRTVERLVLLPVARAIAEGKVPAGSLLRLVARGGQVGIEVSPPEPCEAAESEPPAPRPVPFAARGGALLKRVQDLNTQAAPLAARKSELLSLSAAPGFWDDGVASRRVLDEVYRLDGILAQLAELEKKVRAVSDGVDRRHPSERNQAALEHYLEALESQADQVAFLVNCREPRDLGDAIVTLRLVAAHGDGLDGVGVLARMYKAFALRRGLEVDVLDDRQGGEPREDTITLLLGGAGAYSLLAGEAGLHQLTRGRKEAASGRSRPVDRDVVRVEVLPAPLGVADFPPEQVRVEVRPLDGARGRLLARRKFDVQLFHVPTMTPLHIWTDGSRGEAVARSQTVLQARLEAAKALAAGEGSQQVVRRYRLGPTTLVRDQRTGRHTARLDQVLEGHLDTFLPVPGAGSRGV